MTDPFVTGRWNGQIASILRTETQIEAEFPDLWDLLRHMQGTAMMDISRQSHQVGVMVLILLIATTWGCRSRPIQTVMRGNMAMTGDMKMSGDMSMDGTMDMRGDMNMSGDISTVVRTDNSASRLASVPVYSGDNSQAGRIAVLDVDGLLINQNIGGFGSMGENPVALFREKLDAIAVDETIAGIVLRINSPGGGVTAADVMTRDLLQVKQQRNIPVVACLMDVGAGGAYYLATAADQIVAHPTSLVGGIGVLLNIYVLEDLGAFNVQAVPVKAGVKIDMGTSQRTIEPDERELLQQIADDFHGRFINRVKATRTPNGNGLGIDEHMFDGRVLTGMRAFESHLVDQVGYLDDAVVAARKLAQLPDDAPIVMLRRDNDRAYTLLDVTPNKPTMSSLLPFKIPGLDRSEMPMYLYLWQPEPSMVSGL